MSSSRIFRNLILANLVVLLFLMTLSCLYIYTHITDQCEYIYTSTPDTDSLEQDET